MLKNMGPVLKKAFIAYELCLIIVSYFIVANEVFSKLPFLFIFSAIWLLFALRKGIYLSKRTTRLLKEFSEIIEVATFSIIITSFIAFVLKISVFRDLTLSFGFFVLFFIITSRLIIRLILRSLRMQGYNFRSVVIVGRNKRSISIIKQSLTNPAYGLHIIGVVDDRSDINDINGWPYPEIKFLGKIKDLKEILLRNVVDDVLITIPIKSSYKKIAGIIEDCEEAGIAVKVVADFFNPKIAKQSFSYWGDVPVIKLHTAEIGIFELFIKRALDIALSLMSIFVLLPVFVIVPIIIKLTSAGPVFFKQKRLGLNHRPFTLLKFRSMALNAEKKLSNLKNLNELKGPVFKIKKDPRITSFGRVMRRFSIDELPQLINVLKGDMSLVGPRPPIPHEVKLYDWWQRRRLSMRPGITCLWQVSGRNNVEFEKWVKLDLEYIDNWSLGLDFKILWQTIPAVFKGTGAY